MKKIEKNRLCSIEGGNDNTTCFIWGAFVGLFLVSQNWLGAASNVWGAYRAGCL